MQRTYSINVDAVRRYFGEREDVLVAYLFGSHARGQAGPLSDVDLAVLLARDVGDDLAFRTRIDLIVDLTGVLETNDVDVIILNRAPLALGYRVLRDGVVLSCRDADARVEYHARTIGAYLDFRPFAERHERAGLERARRGELFSGYNRHLGSLERYRRLGERLEGTESL